MLSIRGESDIPGHQALDIGISAIATGAGIGFKIVATALTNMSFVFRYEVSGCVSVMAIADWGVQAEGRMAVTYTMQWHQ